ncbi:MAG: Ig-like domain-containing protein [Ruminococcus sp.]|nr:Ig-like domain-containing protein [Ruminococcus sp.]
MKKYVKSISVKSKATITIPADKKTLTNSYKVTVKVIGKASAKFTAKSSNTPVATVKVRGSNIEITAKKAGKAKITVTTKAKNAKGKKLSKKLALTVKKAKTVTPAPTEPEVDKREGTVTEKSVPWYVYNPSNAQTLCDNSPVFFSSAYPDVPFVSDDFVISYFLASSMYSPECEPEKSDKGLCHTYILPMGEAIVFDYDNKKMIFSDYTSTLVPNGNFMIYNPFSYYAYKETSLYKVSSNDLYYGGEPIVVTFGYDEVPMLRSGDSILIPLQSFSDMFFSYSGQFFSYNGEGVYFIDNNLANDPNRKDYYDQYCNCEKKDTISSALAQVNYYELCNILDARYGLQAAHNIVYFDNYFTRKGIKKRMLSTDLATIEKAQQDISTLLFEDFHSRASIQSVFLKEPVYSDSQMSPVYKNRRTKMGIIEETRNKIMGDNISAYERRGDTVFITFDEFSMESDLDAYYAEGYEPTPDTKDTIALFAYALKRLQNEDSDAKNVVIDLACNGGGTVYVCGYILQAICGQCNINIQNPNTWALHQCVIDFDLNLDGAFDENDKSMLDMGLNVAVIISDHSFSCGNLLPNALDQIDDRILLLGQQSGGGACSVGYISTAIGSTMQISSENRFVTMKNGYIRDIDGGIAPDIYLTFDRMFDREYIVDVVKDKFGN